MEETARFTAALRIPLWGLCRPGMVRFTNPSGEEGRDQEGGWGGGVEIVTGQQGWW